MKARELHMPTVWRVKGSVEHVYDLLSRPQDFVRWWPEVYLDEGRKGGLWLPVDPTFNQFPADATHVRLARGGLDKQAAILPLVGRVKMTILEMDLAPGSSPVLVGRP